MQRQINVIYLAVTKSGLDLKSKPLFGMQSLNLFALKIVAGYFYCGFKQIAVNNNIKHSSVQLANV